MLSMKMDWWMDSFDELQQVDQRDWYWGREEEAFRRFQVDQMDWCLMVDMTEAWHHMMEP
jgi:hypothetical protein